MGFQQYISAPSNSNAGFIELDSPPVPSGLLWRILRATFFVPNFGFAFPNSKIESGIFICPPNTPQLPGAPNGSLPNASTIIQRLPLKIDYFPSWQISGNFGVRTALMFTQGKPIFIPSGWIIRFVALSNNAIFINSIAWASVQYDVISNGQESEGENINQKTFGFDKTEQAPQPFAWGPFEPDV